MEVKKLLKGDLDYMETKIKIKIEYEPTNKIYLSSNEKELLYYLMKIKKFLLRLYLNF